VLDLHAFLCPGHVLINLFHYIIGLKCFRGASLMHIHPRAFAPGRGTWVCSQTSGECTSTGTSPYVNNCLFFFLFPLFFAVLLKRNISMKTWEHIKLGELPKHSAVWFFCWGRSLKIHVRDLLILSQHKPANNSVQEMLCPSLPHCNFLQIGSPNLFMPNNLAI
jgi:hypothetical protein